MERVLPNLHINQLLILQSIHVRLTPGREKASLPITM